MIDITELPPEDRQKALNGMPMWELLQTLRDLMHDNRQSERGVWMDAMTIYILRTNDR